MVVRGTADVVVGQRRGGLDAVDQERLAIQPVLEHGVDVPIRPSPGAPRALAGRIEPLRPVLLRQAQQAETGAIPLFRVRPALENLLDQRLGCGADCRAPAE